MHGWWCRLPTTPWLAFDQTTEATATTQLHNTLPFGREGTCGSHASEVGWFFRLGVIMCMTRPPREDEDIYEYYEEMRREQNKERAKAMRGVMHHLEQALKYADIISDYTGRAAHEILIEELREAYKKPPDPNQRPPLPSRLRRQVFERDEYRCRHCDGYIDLQVDHIVPHSRGGPTTLDNLQTLCQKCNSSKGAK